jgi:hypothetical protein
MTTVNANGSKWAGEPPDDLDTLKQRLKENVLDPSFESYGNFAYAGESGSTRFWGNFFDVSAVFSIDTDEAALISELVGLIRANQAKPEYLRARSDRRATQEAARR